MARAGKLTFLPDTVGLLLPLADYSGFVFLTAFRATNFHADSFTRIYFSTAGGAQTTLAFGF